MSKKIQVGQTLWTNNGESVEVFAISKENVVVRYQGKLVKRSIDAIGCKLFTERPQDQNAPPDNYGGSSLYVRDQEIFNSASSIISRLYGDRSEFREGQYEAIEATLLNKRTLVVQKTGWGKSLVYFVCTKLFRDAGRGVTIVVSPLLVLMDNQLEAASKMGLRCETLNSTVKDRREQIIEMLTSNLLDLVFITPETLLSDVIYSKLKDINIGFFVIDEAHCISDWGHDFRLQYTQLNRVIKTVAQAVPILATTATANNRVVKDLTTQLGGEVFVSRGSLMRSSLSIQILRISEPAGRYAWILQNINNLPGSGIIYCLTRRDCDYLTDFMQKNGINVMSYYSRDDSSLEHINSEAETLFKENKIKALVATVKLGMGYDKEDVAFVIHFQQPSNIVSYYQQIGRAGRNIPRAYTFLMCGSEDKRIQDYFIETAFPTKDESEKVLECISDNEDGTSRGQISFHVNYRFARIEKAILFLENEGFIYKERGRYFVSPKKFEFNEAHYAAITKMRRREQALMDDMIETTMCYSKFVVNCLDDVTDDICGICANCLGYDEFPAETTHECLETAQQYFERLIISIEPRRQWATTAFTRQTRISFLNDTGICLSKYGDPGYGTLVKEDKYSLKDSFREELIGKSASVLRDIISSNNIDVITCVPSLRSNIVQDFSERMARKLGIKFSLLLSKSKAEQQKFMHNSSHQCENALQSFSVIDNVQMPNNVLLVDDIVDSRWTMTVCGYRLMEAGCLRVFPFALADSSQKED